MEVQEKPYILYSNDSTFYVSAQKPFFNQQSFIRINRLTSKITILNQQRFYEEISSAGNIVTQQLFLIAGVLIINQEPYLCVVKAIEPVAMLNTQKVYQIKKFQFIPFKHKFLYKSIDQTQNQKITNYISQNIVLNNFYFCYHQDLTLTYGKMILKGMRENKYFWNQKMLFMFINNNLPNCWVIPMVQGYVKQIYCQNDYFSFYYCVISRRSKYMSGTRFHSRGIDENQNASNFVETEEIFICHNYLFSHISTRGSVPIFWQQAEFGAAIRFSKPEEKNLSNLANHYKNLSDSYEAKIVTINLLSKSKSPEKQLKNRFEFYFVKTLPDQYYLFFDLNEQAKDTENGQRSIDKFIEENQKVISPEHNFLIIDRHTNKIINRQKHVSRINCLDCIDRTNVIMSRISLLFLGQVQAYVNENTNMKEKKIHLTKQYYAEIINSWVEIGNRISMIYCGTESVANHLTKQQNNSFFSTLTGGIKSLTRYYNANINDGFKQQCINFLLNQKDQYSETDYFDDNLTKGVIEEVKYCDYDQIKTYFISWNCNMVEPDQITIKEKEKLFNFAVELIDIVVVNLQQMVQLNTYNVILGNNQSVVGHWKKFIEEHLNQMCKNKQKKYIYLTSYDLVGIATFVFVSLPLCDKIHYQEWVDVKTGFKNTLGNKGAIMLFLIIDSTYLTFINCHLAAGQNSQIERAQDIDFIHFDALNQREKRRFFDKSQYRFFVGDMNFRLEAKNEQVRQILYSIEKQDTQRKMNKSEMKNLLHPLLLKDEFYTSNHKGALSSYNEPAIYFLPTYKYVKKQKIYDTKRTPSWCDRILFYAADRQKLQILKYWDIDCFLSDHKPVCAVFKFLIKKQNPKQKKKLIDIYMKDLA